MAESKKQQDNVKPPPPVFQSVEDIIEDGLNEIASRSSRKPFSFTKRRDVKPSSSTSRQPVGATSRNYFGESDEEEEEDDDESDCNISANFDFGFDDSDDIKVVEETPPMVAKVVKPEFQKQKIASMTVTNKANDDLQLLTEGLSKIPLGGQGIKPPVKSIFLEEPPKVERPGVYAYDPLNTKHQQFYGSVEQAVVKLAKTIQTMPIPLENSEEDKDELPEGLVSLYDHQKYGLKWLSWREGVFPGGGILADEMGLGKTIMIIALIMKSKQNRQLEDGKEKPWIKSDEIQRLTPTRSTLVVCPVGCLLQWQDEISTKGKGLRVLVHHGPNRTNSAVTLAQHDVVLTTYDTVVSDIPKPAGMGKQPSKKALGRLFWHRIVLDEAHNIRNAKTARAISLCQLVARHRWAVTGTPVHNQPGDLFSIAKFLRMTPFDEPKVWDYWIGLKTVKKSQGAQERLHIIGKALILRRTKVEVESMGGNVRAIPPKTVETIELDLSESEQRVYDHLMKFSQAMFKDFVQNKNQRDREKQAAAFTYTAARPKDPKPDIPGDVKFSHLFALICRLRQCAVLPYLIQTMLDEESVNDEDSFDEFREEHLVSKRNPIFDSEFQSSKVKKILDDLEELREKAKVENRPMDKVVIVSSWTSLLDIIHGHLRTRGFSSVFITGREKMEERTDAMKRFNKYPLKPQIVLLSLAAGGVGINLVGGNYVFFVEPHWNPQMEAQAQDRVHRFGQTKDVFIRRYISKGTIESRVLELQAMKLDLADGVLNNTKKSNTGLSIQQMRVLFCVD